MNDPDGYFGERVAATYDDESADMFAAAAVDPAADFLAELAGGGRALAAGERALAGGGRALAGGGRALEFAVGTGRIALPLARRGVEVHGIDLSRAMVARLRAKQGGDGIPVTIGDFSTTRVEGSFSVVYLVYNTIMNLTTQDAQVACFHNAAEHLEPGGCFVVEVGVPELRKLPPGQNVVPFQVGENGWAYDIYDTATQNMSSNYVRVEGGTGQYHSIPFRYVWPAELDLMARLAGLDLRERWQSWTREPFTGESGKHISVWQKPVV